MKNEVFSLYSGSVKINDHTVLKSIFVQLFQKETTGILFNNTDEKNAFIKLLTGEVTLHYGRLYINDRLINELESPRLLQESVYVVKNPTSLCKQFSILENFYYGEFHSFQIRTNIYREKTMNILKQFEFHLNPATLVAQLSSFECTMIEMMKAYVGNYKIIVLANVTGALDHAETEKIIQMIAQMKELGTSFLLIGAFEEILYEQTDQISIIQGGRTIGTFERAQLDASNLHKLLYKYSLLLKDEDYNASYKKVFSLHHVTSHILKDINFSVYHGEVMKIIYSDDASAKDLTNILKGNNRNYKGRIYLDRTLYQVNSIADSLKSGLGFIEENPIETMLFKNLTIIDNICYPLSSKINGFWLRRTYQNSVKKRMNNLIDSHDFKKTISEVSIETLYLILYCKWLLFMPKVLLCINPFSIADIQINQIINEMIHHLSNRGISIIILTSYWPSSCSIQGKVYYLENGNLIGDNKKS